MNAAIHWISARTPHQDDALAIGALVALLAAGRIVRAFRKTSRVRRITALVNIAALIATTVQASGMWKFFGDTMGLPIGFRIFMFAFLEIALLACGMRARGNVEAGRDAGLDGILVWVFALASGCMSATAASSGREAMMRVLVSIAVALLWTRDLLAAKRAARKALTGPAKAASAVRWRVTRERIAVALRLADATDTDVSALDAARRVVRFLRATDRASRGLRNPLSAAARADRARTRMFTYALLHHGNPTALHTALATSSLDKAIARAGVTPDSASRAASDTHPEPDITADQGRTRRAPKNRTAPRSRRAAKRLSDAQLMVDVERLNAASLAADGRPVSLRKLQSELHIGQARATALLDALATAPEAAPEQRIALVLGQPIRRGMFTINGTPQH